MSLILVTIYFGQNKNKKIPTTRKDNLLYKIDIPKWQSITSTTGTLIISKKIKDYQDNQ